MKACVCYDNGIHCKTHMIWTVLRDKDKEAYKGTHKHREAGTHTDKLINYMRTTGLTQNIYE